MRTSELNNKVFSYILQAIDGEGYERTFSNDTERLQFLADTFKSEYGWYAEQVGHLKAFREWLMGLPSSFNVDFENYRIIEIAKEWGSLSPNATERQEDKILDNWFSFIANKTFQLMKKHKVLPY